METAKDSRQMLGRLTAARLLDCSPQTIDKYIKEKKLPGYRLGRKVLVKYADLMHLLRSIQ